MHNLLVFSLISENSKYSFDVLRMYLKYLRLSVPWYNAPYMSAFACVMFSAVVTPDEWTKIDLDLEFTRTNYESQNKDGIQTIAQSMLIHNGTILKSILNQSYTVPKI